MEREFSGKREKTMSDTLAGLFTSPEQTNHKRLYCLCDNNKLYNNLIISNSNILMSWEFACLRFESSDTPTDLAKIFFSYPPHKREPSEPNADNNDGRRGVRPGLSIGAADGQIMKNRHLDIQVVVFYAILISEYDII